MYREVLCTLHPVLTPCITIPQYQKQEIDISTVYRAYLGFTTYACIHLCVSMCVAQYNLITWVVFVTTTIIKINHHKIPSCSPFTTTPPPFSSPIPEKH